MDNDKKRPSAALINREWYQSAASILSRQDLGLLLVQCVEYVFGTDGGHKLTGTADIVYKMVLPALDSDIDKYTERCERNKRNARSQSQPVAASRSQSQPVAANTTTTSTTTTTTTSTTTPSLSPEEVDERDRWLIFGYFWSVGSKAITQECEAFWSYYESLGWKNNKGAPIVHRLACARQWNRKFETGTAPNGADAWFKAMQSCNIYDCNAFKCYLGAEREETGAVVRLRCKTSFLESLKAAVPNLERTLGALWRVPAVRFETSGA